jgi:hypothetical protein
MVAGRGSPAWADFHSLVSAFGIVSGGREFGHLIGGPQLGIDLALGAPRYLLLLLFPSFLFFLVLVECLASTTGHKFFLPSAILFHCPIRLMPCGDVASRLLFRRNYAGETGCSSARL